MKCIGTPRLRVGNRTLLIALILIGAVWSRAAENPNLKSAKTAPSAQTQPSVSEVSYGKTLAFKEIRSIVLTRDAKHLAFIGSNGDQQFVVFDGVQSAPYEWVVPDSLTLAPSGTGAAYCIQTSKQTLAVIDGKPGKGYYSIERDRIIYSSNGSRAAYCAHPPGNGAVIVESGAEGTRYDAVDWPLFSEDSVHLAYRATLGKEQFIVIDGKEQKHFDSITEASFLFSPDGTHFTYDAVVGGKHSVVVDGKTFGPYDAVKLGPGFSAAGANWAAVVYRGEKAMVNLNGKESPEYDGLIAGDFTFSPDGKHMAYGAKRGKQQFVVLDGVEQEMFDALGNGTLRFSPDSAHLTYQAATDKKASVLLDARRVGPVFEGELAGTPIFSPDSKRLLFAGVKAGKWSVVVDGVEDEPYDMIEAPSFSPDSKRVLYARKKGADWAVMVDGKPGRSYQSLGFPIFSPDSKRTAYRAIDGSKGVAVIDGVHSDNYDVIGPIVFSPDSKHACYLERRGNQTHLVVDGVEVGQPFDGKLPSEKPFFDDNSTAHFLASRNSEFLRVTVKMPG